MGKELFNSGAIDNELIIVAYAIFYTTRLRNDMLSPILEIK